MYCRIFRSVRPAIYIINTGRGKFDFPQGFHGDRDEISVE